MCIFKSPQAPQNPTPVSTPPPIIDTTKDNEASKKARAAEEARAKAAKGMSSTIATSPLGVTSPATTQKASLLGYTS